MQAKNEKTVKNIFSSPMKRQDETRPLWRIDEAPVPYLEAVETMEEYAHTLIQEGAPERVWMLTHPHVYTLGTSAHASHILRADVPAVATGRGGQVTYHGPGQLILYPILDLRARAKDLRAYVWALEEWLIVTLEAFGIDAQRREGRVGLWVTHKGREKKIAAIGVRVRSWVAFHGAALNINPDLSYFQGIVPCGLSQFGVTSMAEMLESVNEDHINKVISNKFDIIF